MHPSIITTVDVVLFTLLEGNLAVGLLRRSSAPFEGELALPGGYIHAQEDASAQAAAYRVLHSKTGIEAPYLEQLYTFASADRDPRGWAVSITYYALVGAEQLMAQAHDDFVLKPVADLPALPFDHGKIIEAGVARLQNKSAYSALPCFLLGETFTLSELQETYERILGQKLDKSVFRRKIDELEFLEELAEKRRGQHRPAQLYRIHPERGLRLFDKAI